MHFIKGNYEQAPSGVVGVFCWGGFLGGLGWIFLLLYFLTWLFLHNVQD